MLHEGEKMATKTKKKKPIGQVLVEEKLLSRKQIAEVLKAQESSNKLIGELLLERQMISELLLYQALARQYEMPFIDLSEKKLNKKLVQEIPIEIAEEYKLIPLEIRGGNLILAVSAPQAKIPVTEICLLTKAKGVRTVLALPDQVVEAIHKYYF